MLHRVYGTAVVITASGEDPAFKRAGETGLLPVLNSQFAWPSAAYMIPLSFSFLMCKTLACEFKQ